MSPERILQASVLFGALSAGFALGLGLVRWGSRRLSQRFGLAAHLLGGAIALLFATLLLVAVLVVFFGMKLEG